MSSHRATRAAVASHRSHPVRFHGLGAGRILVPDCRRGRLRCWVQFRLCGHRIHSGRTNCEPLPPGPYLVRAHLAGTTSQTRGQMVRRSSEHTFRVVNRLTPADRRGRPRRRRCCLPRLAPCRSPFGVTVKPEERQSPSSRRRQVPARSAGEIAWRLSHARRSILKDGGSSDCRERRAGWVQRDSPSPRAFSHAVESSAASRPRTSSPTPRFLASSTFSRRVRSTRHRICSRRGRFSARSVANMLVGAPAGEAGWTIRGAVTQGDIASWVGCRATTSTRTPGRHHYDIGMASTARSGTTAAISRP